jgi:hypothetical protein
MRYLSEFNVLEFHTRVVNYWLSVLFCIHTPFCVIAVLKTKPASIKLLLDGGRYVTFPRIDGYFALYPLVELSRAFISQIFMWCAYARCKEGARMLV